MNGKLAKMLRRAVKQGHKDAPIATNRRGGKEHPEGSRRDMYQALKRVYRR